MKDMDEEAFAEILDARVDAIMSEESDIDYDEARAKATRGMNKHRKLLNTEDDLFDPLY